MPTLRGLGVLVAGILALLAALTWHYGDLGLVAVACGAALLIGLASMIWPHQIEFRREVEPSRVERGQVALARVTFRNLGARSFSCRYALEQCGRERLTLRLPRIRSGGAGHVAYRIPTARRGVLDIGPMVLVREDALGLFRRTDVLGDPERVFVHPVAHRLAGLPFGLTRSLEGPDRSHVPHGSITFHALRDYVRGDDLRYVHWKATARLGTLMIREHIDTSVARVTLVLDVSRNCYETDDQFEDAVEAAASIARTAVIAGYAVHLVSSDGASALSESSGKRSDQLLGLLSAVEQTGTASLPRTVARLDNERSHDLLVVVAGRLSPTDLGQIAKLARRFHRTAIAMICDEDGPSRTGIISDNLVLRAPSASKFVEIWNRVVA